LASVSVCVRFPLSCGWCHCCLLRTAPLQTCLPGSSSTQSAGLWFVVCHCQGSLGDIGCS
jgi:hypothetical protein